MDTIAILITSYNRKEKTLSCLRQLLNKSTYFATFLIHVYLVDDGSTDGTAYVIKKEFPEVKIIQGTGNLYWSGGMRLAWRTALDHGGYDYYLLLNDDTILLSNAIDILLISNKKNKAENHTEVITIGTTIDRETGKISYGGSLLRNKFSPKSDNIFKENVDMVCDLGNANIMMVPKDIVDKIGILSDKFTHGLADFDYTLKAKKAGFWVMVAPFICGYCKNDHGKRWKSVNVKLTERIKFLYSPKGLAYKEYMYFIKIHFPLSFPGMFIKLWTKTFFPFIYDWFKK